MSFGISGPDPTGAIQPSHHTNDGGAGNLGYFQQGKKKKKDDKEENDTLELSTKKEEKELEIEEKKPDSIGTKIKTFWFNLHGIFNEVVDEEAQQKNT